MQEKEATKRSKNNSNILDKLKGLKAPALSIYPLFIIVSIPLLLVINTLWNLRSFSRDANFLVRHQATSIAESLTPFIEANINDTSMLKTIMANSVASNSDVVSATLLRGVQNKVEVVATTQVSIDTSNLTEQALNQFAIGLNQPFAGLTYEPSIQQNVWNVVVPILRNESGDYLFNLTLSTNSVNNILSRTSKDSLLILTILVIVTIILIANHFIFYIRSLKAKHLEELDKLKDEFLSMAAHELRTPMTALIGYLDLLQKKITPDQLKLIQEDFDTLDNLIQDLNKLIADLLDVSRVEQGRLTINLQQVDINEVIAKVIKTLTPKAQSQNLQLNFNPVVINPFQSDPERLRQIMTNLIGNSIKYTLEGKIDVWANITKDNVIVVTVKDTGIGIKGEDLPKLFGKFSRIQDTKTAEVRGTGLGLWITKQIIELLGGKISVESIYGTGTSITFTLPAKTAPVTR